MAARPITPEEIKEHNKTNNNKDFWAVIDGYVVDATAFLSTHPGGLKKLLSADNANIGATGRPFGFSFSKGRNSHFGHTARRFENGIKEFLNGKTEGSYLVPQKVRFPKPGKSIIILGKLKRS